MCLEKTLMSHWYFTIISEEFIQFGVFFIVKVEKLMEIYKRKTWVMGFLV